MLLLVIQVLVLAKFIVRGLISVQKVVNCKSLVRTILKSLILLYVGLTKFHFVCLYFMHLDIFGIFPIVIIQFFNNSCLFIALYSHIISYQIFYWGLLVVISKAIFSVSGPLFKFVKTQFIDLFRWFFYYFPFYSFWTNFILKHQSLVLVDFVLNISLLIIYKDLLSFITNLFLNLRAHTKFLAYKLLFKISFIILQDHLLNLIFGFVHNFKLHR